MAKNPGGRPRNHSLWFKLLVSALHHSYLKKHKKIDIIREAGIPGKHYKYAYELMEHPDFQKDLNGLKKLRQVAIDAFIQKLQNRPDLESVLTAINICYGEDLQLPKKTTSTVEIQGDLTLSPGIDFSNIGSLNEHKRNEILEMQQQALLPEPEFVEAEYREMKG